MTSVAGAATNPFAVAAAMANAKRGDREAPIHIVYCDLLPYSVLKAGDHASTNPLAWYAGKANLAPLLHGVVAEVSVTPATSVAAEQSFSHSRARLTYSRTNLLPKNFRREIWTSLRMKYESSDEKPKVVTIPVLYFKLTVNQKNIVWKESVTYDR